MPTITAGAIKQRYHYNLQRQTIESWVGLLTDDFDSDQAVEKYPWLGSSPKMREWTGTRRAKQLADYDFEVRNSKFEATQDIPGEYIRRGRFKHVDRLIGGLAVRNVRHWGSLISRHMKDGETAAAYDGVSYFGSHTIGDAGAQSNDLSYDATSPTAPTVDEAGDAVMEAIQTIVGFLDDEGEPMNDGCTSFLVMIPHTWLKTFAIALGNEIIVSAGSAITNPTAAFNGFTIQLYATPRLANAQDGGTAWTTKFATFCVDGWNKPFIRQEETAMSQMTKILREGSDHEFDNDSWKVGIQASRAVGYGSWETAALTTFV